MIKRNFVTIMREFGERFRNKKCLFTSETKAKIKIEYDREKNC